MANPFALACAAFKPFNSLAMAPRFAELPLDFASRLPRLPLELPRFELPPFSANAGVAETLIAIAGGTVNRNAAAKVLATVFITLFIKNSSHGLCRLSMLAELTTSKQHEHGDLMTPRPRF
ncbi:MAG: hypothetical protein KC448_04440 [Yoonia sp.]|nr:hypothetical protein [Yoonia sp.]